jgi:hypothetical protein
MPGRRDFHPVLIGLAIGAAVSLVLLLGSPLWFGVCFFLIGSEAHPVGPVLFFSYVATAVLSPPVGCIVGLMVKRSGDPPSPPRVSN